ARSWAPPGWQLSARRWSTAGTASKSSAICSRSESWGLIKYRRQGDSKTYLGIEGLERARPQTPTQQRQLIRDDGDQDGLVAEALAHLVGPLAQLQQPLADVRGCGSRLTDG